MTTNFNHFELPDFLIKSLNIMGINEPTPIQASAIPPGISGQDILASAQTGTGKTLAYLIPLISRLLNTPTDTALVLTPTRELAMQVKDTAEKLLHKKIPYAVALLIGGDPMYKQLNTLKKSPRIIVGTPGRINDHLSRNSLKLQKTRFFVIDEADRMLDMGFEEDLENIMQKLPNERQTFMFSATMPPDIVKLSQKYLSTPERISLGHATKPTEQVRQQTINTTASDKFSCLLKELKTREGSIIVFVKTKIGADDLASKLKRENLSVDAIHGNLRQQKRERVITAFRDEHRDEKKRIRILIATDIAARGLDIPHVRHVVNYDLPQCPEDYIHRIGRTGRAGREGEALSLIVPADRRIWQRINDFMQQKNGVTSSASSSRNKGGRKNYSKTTSLKNKPPRRFASEPRRFSGHSPYAETHRTSSEPRRFGGNSPHAETHRTSSEPRRFSGHSPYAETHRTSSEPRRFSGHSPHAETHRTSSEPRRFSGNSPHAETHRTSSRRNSSERYSENRKARPKSRFSTREMFDVPAMAHSLPPTKPRMLPKISFKSKAQGHYNKKVIADAESNR